MIKKLDEMVEKLIQMTTSKGEVYIITNATKGWVEYSSKLYQFIYVGTCRLPMLSCLTSPSLLFLLGRCMDRSSLEITGDGKLRLSRASSRR